MNLETTLQKRYKTQKEAKSSFIRELIQAQQDHRLKTEAFAVAVAAVKAFDIVKRPTENQNNDNILYIWNPDMQYHTELRYEISKHCTHAISALNLKSDEKSLSEKVMRFLQSEADDFEEFISDFNPPPRHMLLLNDGVFDCKSGKYTDEKDVNHLHFTSRSPFSRKENLDALYVQIWERAMFDWTDGDKDKEQFLWDYLRCVIEGNNKGRALLIIGSGGNGKSTFISMCESLLQKQSIFRLNMHEAENAFALEGLDSETRLITGDELRSNYRIGGESLSRYKSIIDGQAIRINPKGKTMYDVQPLCCVIQASNTMPKWAENNDANKDRFIVMLWSSTNYRAKKRNGEFDFNLQELMKDHVFVETVFNLILDKTEYSEHLYVPPCLEELTDTTIGTSDNVKLFVDYLKDENYLQNSARVPVNVMKACFDVWLRNENPSAGVMSKTVFSERFTTEMQTLGFKPELSTSTHTIPRKRIASLTYLDFDKTVVEDLLGMSDSEISQSRIFKSKSIVLANEHNELSESEQAEIIDMIQTSNVDLSNAKHVRMLRYLIHDKRDAIVASQWNEALKDI